MTGLEIEDLSVSALKAAAAAEYFAAREPARKDKLVGFGNFEMLTVGRVPPRWDAKALRPKRAQGRPSRAI